MGLKDSISLAPLLLVGLKRACNQSSPSNFGAKHRGVSRDPSFKAWDKVDGTHQGCVLARQTRCVYSAIFSPIPFSGCDHAACWEILLGPLSTQGQVHPGRFKPSLYHSQGGGNQSWRIRDAPVKGPRQRHL